MNAAQDIRDLMLTHQISLREAVAKIVDAMSIDDLRAGEIKSLIRKVERQIRTEAMDATTTPEQMLLLEVGRHSSRIVTYEIEGELFCVGWQDASRLQTIEHYERAYRRKRTELGIIERDLGHWQRLDAPLDIPIREWLFRDVVCCICGLPARHGDPMVIAHDVPVAARTGNTSTHLAHESCNLLEGTGGGA